MSCAKATATLNHCAGTHLGHMGCNLARKLLNDRRCEMWLLSCNKKQHYFFPIHSGHIVTKVSPLSLDGSTWRSLDQPRLNIGSEEVQLGPKTSQLRPKSCQQGPKLALLGRRWDPRELQLRSTWSQIGSQMVQHDRNRDAKL